MVVRGFSVLPVFFLLQLQRSSFGTWQTHWPVMKEVNDNEKVKVSDEMG
jgi:hypothetical protein